MNTGRKRDYAHSVFSPLRIARYPLLAVIAFLFCGASIVSANGSDADELHDRVEKLEQENKELRELLRAMQNRLDEIEQRPAETAKPATPEMTPTIEPPPIVEELERQIEDIQDGLESSWLPSLGGDEFRLGGRVRVNYFNPQRETELPSARTRYPDGTFQFDEFRLQLDADLSRRIRFYSKFDAVSTDDSTRLAEAYIRFREFPLESELYIGLLPYFYRPSRETAHFPLPGVAIWKNRDVGVIWEANYDPFVLYASVMNGLELDTRRIGFDRSADIISMDRADFNFSNEMEFGAGLGLEFDFDQYGEVSLLGFGTTGKLSNRDVGFLQREVPGYGQSFSKRQERIGANLGYEIDNWELFAQTIFAQDGEMDRLTWYAEASHRFRIRDMRWLRSIRPLIRYSALDTGLNPRPYSADGSLTWDRSQWLFAIITELARNITFRTEYALNLEDTGGPDIRNNELLFQLEVAF